MDSKSPRARLLDHLGGVAGYNDKGFHWSRHSPEQVRAFQEEAQGFILKMVAEIGEGTFSAALLEKLKSGEASRDGSGAVWEMARRELGEQDR